jgi:formamidopyrimidine-DNA glycosylase
MPELPEVEYNRSIINEHCLNLKIFKVNKVDDNLVFANEFPDLVGSKFIGTDRYGKYLWVETMESSFLLVHLGMTGFVQVKGNPRTLYRSAPEKAHSEDWPPRFTKLHLFFEGGVELVFGDARRLGRIKYCESQSVLQKCIKDLGFDPTKNPPESLECYLKNRKVPIKSMLLDQKFSAGIGNWMADDILYNAQIHPQKNASDLTEKERINLLKSIIYIATKSTQLKLANETYPEEWLFHCRWDVRISRQKSFSSLGRKVQVVKVGGRTTIYCPEVQKFDLKAGSPTTPLVEDGVERDGNPPPPTPNRPKRNKGGRKA